MKLCSIISYNLIYTSNIQWNKVYMMAAATCQWLSTVNIKGTAPSPREGHAVAVNGEDIYLFGGSSCSKGGESITCHGDFYRLSVQKDLCWKKLGLTGHPPSSRDEHSMCLHGNQLYVYGGKNQITARNCLPGLYVYDIGYREWEYVHTMGTAPSSLSHTMSCVGSIMYVYGGYLDGVVTNQMYMLNLYQLTWTKLITSGFTHPRCDHSAAVISDQIYIFGGCGGEDIWLNDLQVFDTNTLSWITASTTNGIPPPARGRHTLTAHGSKDVYVFGGINDSMAAGGTRFNDLYNYNISEETWSRTACSGLGSTQRYGHTAAIIHGHMYIIGGINRNGELNDISILKLCRQEAASSKTSADKNTCISVKGEADDAAKQKSEENLDRKQMPERKSYSKHDASTAKPNAEKTLDDILRSLKQEIGQLQREKMKLDADKWVVNAEKRMYSQKRQELESKTSNHIAAAKEWLDLREQYNKKDKESIDKQKKQLLMD